MAFPYNNSWHNAVDRKENIMKETLAVSHFLSALHGGTQASHQGQVEQETPVRAAKNSRSSGTLPFVWDLQ